MFLEKEIQVKLAGKTAQMLNTETWTFYDAMCDINDIFFYFFKWLKENKYSWSFCMYELTKCFEEVKKIIFEEKQILDLLATALYLLGKVNKTQINYIFSEKKLSKELNDIKVDEINPYFGIQVCNSEQELETIKIDQVFIYELISILVEKDIILERDFSLWYERFLLQNKDQNKRKKFLKSWINNSSNIDLEKYLLKKILNLLND